MISKKDDASQRLAAKSIDPPHESKAPFELDVIDERHFVTAIPPLVKSPGSRFCARWPDTPR
jgi:hypothetical protein